MVAYQCHIGYIQLLKDLPCPFILLFRARVGEVSTMHHEIDVVTLVNVVNLCLGIGVPAMGVADESEAQGVS